MEHGADAVLVERMYVNEIDEIPLANGFTASVYDVVLIDGRFRIECALKLLSAGHINAESVVMIHDYRERAQYHVVEEFFDRIREDDTKDLGIFVMKDHIDQEALNAAVEKYHGEMS